MYVYSALEQ